MLDVAEDRDGVTFRVRVVPRASRTEVTGLIEGAVRIRLAASPVDGVANTELILFVSKHLAVPSSNVKIISGQTSKIKRLRVAGVTAAEVSAKLSKSKLVSPKSA